MSNYFLFYAAFLVLIGSCGSVLVAQDQTDEPFIGNNQGILQIEGTGQAYEFISNHVSARINKDDSKMEFIFPLNSFSPADNDPVHLEIYNDIFASSFPLLIYLTVPFDREAVDAEDFSQPINLVLNGVLTFVDESVQLPVEVSLFSVNGKIFYNMATRFNLDQIDRSYNGIFKDLITGEFGLIINDAIWNEIINERR